MALKEIGAMVYIGDPILASSLVFAVEKKMNHKRYYPGGLQSARV